eukprot:gnl/TRDRNA2_/TRDRNA2_183952_c0_seq1.p1 gnl/TRDRNA2_/TRDRNA2_183952_c0~~gnl/TRDRNA2_/TRDRNA2_183952_c0_seq1.p1  ORF type:complete len:299 (-),score=38.99 gnl/TRDRNA2_/TRDRNA2_183952_c0_seq1:170-1066(-)
MGGPCTVDGKVRAELDNFYICQIELDGKIRPSSEHYYQASKFPNDDEQRDLVRLANSGMESWQCGNRGHSVRSDWEEVKVDMMYRANLAKFSQDARLRAMLTESRGEIVAQGGHFWKTWNEVILERIREELRDKTDRRDEVLAARILSMSKYRSAAQDKDEHAVAVVTKWSAMRKTEPQMPSAFPKALVVSCHGHFLSSDIDDVYRIDGLHPEANGHPHYRSKGGMHLYLGDKHRRRAWCIDSDYMPGEASGAAFLPAAEGGEGDSKGIPLGEQVWQLWDGSRHSPSTLTVRVCENDA